MKVSKMIIKSKQNKNKNRTHKKLKNKNKNKKKITKENSKRRIRKRNHMTILGHRTNTLSCQQFLVLLSVLQMPNMQFYYN